MSNIELYYPETIAKKNGNNSDIYFNLSFTNDFSGNDITKNFTNNFARNDAGSIIKSTAQSLYINSAEKFPPLTDPNYQNNYATHYLVIVQTNDKGNTDNCVAIPICNNYDGNWSQYAKDFKNTQVKSIDNLIKNQNSTLIDLNSTMNELKGNVSGGNYAKYSIKIDENTVPIYVINKFIYVEKQINASFYKKIITTSFASVVPDSIGNYSIASITADCGPYGNINNASQLFDMGNDMDFSKFIIYNVLLIFSYAIALIVFYKLHFKYSSPFFVIFFFLIFSTPFFVYFFYKYFLQIDLIKWTQKNKKIKLNESYTDYVKLLVLSMIYSFIIVGIAFLRMLIPEILSVGFGIKAIYNSVLYFFIGLYYDHRPSKILLLLLKFSIFSVVILGGYELTRIPLITSMTQPILNNIKNLTKKQVDSTKKQVDSTRGQTKNQANSATKNQIDSTQMQIVSATNN
jgi:hypothetical protein